MSYNHKPAILGGLIVAAAWGAHRAEVTPPTQSGPALETLVGRYFHEASEAERGKLLAQIREAVTGSWEVVRDAVQTMSLWDDVPGPDRVVVQTASAGEVGLIYRGFNDPAQLERRGLVLCMSAAPGLGEAGLTIQRAMMILGPTLYEHSFVVALDKPVAHTFHQHPAAGDDLRKIMRELRRRFRLDTDRVFLFGYGEGGAGTWNVAMFHPQFSAGAVIVASHPRLPYPEQLVPLLLPNLGGLPVLSVFEDAEEPTAGPDVLPAAIYNRAIVQFGEQHGLSLRGLETSFRPMETAQQADDLPSSAAIERDVLPVAQHRRPPPGGDVSRWFRYPSQGDLGWVRATKWHAEPWVGEQVSIAPGAGTDRDEFITAFFKENLFRLAGRIEGQIITLETKGIAEVEVVFYEGMVDLTRPITVTINGRKRHEAIIKPSIETLLEEAYADWEFQRVAVARLVFTIAAQP